MTAGERRRAALEAVQEELRRSAQRIEQIAEEHDLTELWELSAAIERAAERFAR